MQWITPKTDWTPTIDAQGKYTGDYLNIEDYNRIKNNIEFLAHTAKQFWPVKVKAMPDKEYQEYPYADEINQISDNLDEINKYIGYNIGTKTEYSENGAFIDKLRALYSKPRSLPFRIGSEYWPLKQPKVIRPARTHLPFTLGTRLGGAYYPFKNPEQVETPTTKQKQLPYRLGAEYWPFKE